MDYNKCYKFSDHFNPGRPGLGWSFFFAGSITIYDCPANHQSTLFLPCQLWYTLRYDQRPFLRFDSIADAAAIYEIFRGLYSAIHLKLQTYINYDRSRCTQNFSAPQP